MKLATQYIFGRELCYILHNHEFHPNSLIRSFLQFSKASYFCATLYVCDDKVSVVEIDEYPTGVVCYTGVSC
jgi:hypothetical protein